MFGAPGGSGGSVGRFFESFLKNQTIVFSEGRKNTCLGIFLWFSKRLKDLPVPPWGNFLASFWRPGGLRGSVGRLFEPFLRNQTIVFEKTLVLELSWGSFWSLFGASMSKTFPALSFLSNCHGNQEFLPLTALLILDAHQHCRKSKRCMHAALFLPASSLCTALSKQLHMRHIRCTRMSSVA